MPASGSKKEKKDKKDEGEKENVKEEEDIESYKKRKIADLENLGRSGGVYVPPFKLARMQKEIEDKTSAEYQRQTWEALRKSINGLVNKVNVGNIKNIELFQENLVRGRGLLVRALIRAQMASPGFTHVFAALLAVINSKLPGSHKGAAMEDLSKAGCQAIFERFRTILHEGEIDKRVQYVIEGLFETRRKKFSDHPMVLDELDLVEDEDQITHEVDLLDETIKGEETLNIFKAIPPETYAADEAKWKLIAGEILGLEQDEGSDSSEDSDEEADAAADRRAQDTAAESRS
eukprot:g24933.t1